MAFLEVLPPVIAPALISLKQLHRQAPLVVLQRNVEQLVLENSSALASYPFVAGNETGELLPQGALQLLDNVILPPLGVNIAVLPQAQVPSNGMSLRSLSSGSSAAVEPIGRYTQRSSLSM